MSEDQAPYEKEPAKDVIKINPVQHHLATVDPVISMIERVATNPDASVEALERMLAMKERIDDRRLEEQKREQRQAYYTAMATCQSKLKVVVKNKKNDHTKSSYADLAALAQSVDPVIHEHGFTLSFQPAGTDEKGDQLIKWTVAHRSGHIESGTAALPVDKAGSQGKVNKTDLQAFGSTASYGRRYLKLMLFDIATGDDNDGNQAKPTENISAAQLEELLKLADDLSVDKKAFCEWAEVASFAEIAANKFNDARNAILAKGKKKAEKEKNDG